MHHQKFDAIVVGSGQAGTPLVFKMAAKGLSVAFIEKADVGGTCVNTGCTPTKAYVASARKIFDTQHTEKWGIILPHSGKTDLKKVKARKDLLVQESREGISSEIEKKEKITFFKGDAHFTGEYTLEVNGAELTASKIFINVGARPVIPDSFKRATCLTNKEMLELESIPEHLIIVGGSYIGLEFGQMFRRFGSKITIVEKKDRVISKEDEDVSKEIQRILEKEGVEFRLNATCLDALDEEDGRVTVNISCDDGPAKVKGSHLLVAVGRTPNTDTLQLSNSKITVDEKGYIEVNEKLETSIPGIYALGDCNGKGAFTHTSYNDYEIVSANLFEDGDRKISDRILNYAIYVDPPMGRAGITLQQAKERDLNVLVGFKKMDKIARAKEKGETDGFMRLIIDGDSNKILGATVLGVGGDEIISSILNIMYADAPYTTIRDSVYPHPTVSELIPTLLEDLKPINEG